MKKILLPCFFIVFVSCNKLDEGVVLSKKYEPRTEKLQLIPVQIGYITVLQQYCVVDDADYILTIKGIYDGKERVEYLYVSENKFNCVQIGDTVKIDKDCSKNDNNNQKVNQ